MIGILRRLARIKARSLRFGFYINILQLALLVSIRGFAWWYLFVLLAGAIIYFFELKIGINEEINVAYQNSDEWKKFMVRLTKLEDKIGRLQ